MGAVRARPGVHPYLPRSAIAGLYQQERRLARLTTAVGTVALVTACLGLYGLAALMARRRRGGGVRKALGATVGQVLRPLIVDLLRLVGVGLLIPVPLGMWAVHRWFRQFAYAVVRTPPKHKPHVLYRYVNTSPTSVLCLRRCTVQGI